MDCRTRINPLYVIININHIRFITNKWDWNTFLFMLFLKFNVFLLHVSFFLIKETYGFLLNINLRRHFTFSFFIGWSFVLPPRCQLALSSSSITSLPSFWTHMIMSLLIDHFSLYVLYYMLKGSYYCGRVFII